MIGSRAMRTQGSKKASKDAASMGKPRGKGMLGSEPCGLQTVADQANGMQHQGDDEDAVIQSHADDIAKLDKTSKLG
eukprot:gene13008-3507_t